MQAAAAAHKHQTCSQRVRILRSAHQHAAAAGQRSCGVVAPKGPSDLHSAVQRLQQLLQVRRLLPACVHQRQNLDVCAGQAVRGVCSDQRKVQKLSRLGSRPCHSRSLPPAVLSTHRSHQHRLAARFSAQGVQHDDVSHRRLAAAGGSCRERGGSGGEGRAGEALPSVHSTEVPATLWTLASNQTHLHTQPNPSESKKATRPL